MKAFIFNKDNKVVAKVEEKELELLTSKSKLPKKEG